MGGAVKSNTRSAFLWDVGPVDIRIYHGSKSHKVLHASVARTGKPRGEETGKEVTLHFGKLFLRCKFFRRSGLLLTERDGKKSYGKPSANLLKALRSLTATNIAAD